jgi:hypothetical protein
MNIEKLDDNCYYYTNIVSQEEIDKVIETIKKSEGWIRVYNDGKTYDPNRNPDLEQNQSVMLAFRKKFDAGEYPEVYEIMNRAFKMAADHYKKDKGIRDGLEVPIFTHVDKHLQGTVYKTHIDTAPVELESYSVLFYLNEDYQGGELSFSIPSESGKIKVKNGILEEGPKGTYHPNHEVNKDLVSFWIKPKAFSVVIFPPLKPTAYPHTAHEVVSGEKYIIKGHWQIDKELATQWSANPYEGLSEKEILEKNPEGFIKEGYQHNLIKEGKQILSDQYKEFYL